MLASFAMFPAVASEPEPGDYEPRPGWVYAGMIIMAAVFLLGGVLIVVASRWHRERWRAGASLEVQVFRAGPRDPRNTWVRVIDRSSGATGESTTERTIRANQERALDLLMQQLGR